MSIVLAMIAAGSASHVVAFTRYEVSDPTPAQVEAYEAGDKARLVAMLPVADRVTLELRDGERRGFAGAKLAGYAALEVEDDGYLLRFDTGSYEAATPFLLGPCGRHVFYVVRSKAGGRTRIVAQDVVVGRDC